MILGKGQFVEHFVFLYQVLTKQRQSILRGYNNIAAEVHLTLTIQSKKLLIRPWGKEYHIVFQGILIKIQ